MKKVMSKSEIKFNVNKKGVKEGVITLKSDDPLFLEALYKLQKIVENHTESMFELFIDIANKYD